MATQTFTLPLPATTTLSSTKQATIEKADNDVTAKPSPPLDPFHDLVAGYPKLAGRMGVMPEIAMFRQFGALNARNLLYLQNDLIMLEKQLKQIELHDSKSHEGEKRNYRKNAFWLSSADFELDNEPRDGDTIQHDLVLKMRGLLNEYNTTLIQQATIFRELEKPDAFDIDDIQHFLASEDMVVISDSGKAAYALIGPERDLWGSVDNPKGYNRELVVLRARKDIDTFSRTAGAKAIKWIRACGGRRWKKQDVRWGTIAIHDATVYKLTFWLTSGIASILPVISIILLVRMESLTGRLGIIAAFNVLTSICLTFFTEARRTDVFAVTAAFAAVQVVFVGQVIEKSPQDVIIAGSKIANCAC